MIPAAAVLPAMASGMATGARTRLLPTASTLRPKGTRGEKILRRVLPNWTAW